MTIFKRIRRPIGRILLDGGFVSQDDLGRALAEQKQTSELLGQVLVRMGVLDSADLSAVLAIQDHLDGTESAAGIAAGVRQMLGSLLVQAGHITSRQLDCAIAEQRKSGEKLGEVLVRLGLLTASQLGSLLDFQRNQNASSVNASPLRLGEILVSAGYITRSQLAEALQKQTSSGKKLGEVLVDEGHVKPQQVNRGIRLQHMLLTAVLVALLGACGGGGSVTETPSTQAASTESQEQAHTNYFITTSDDYGLREPNFYYSTDNSEFWSIQSAVANDVNDPEFQSIIRIDMPTSENGGVPDISGKVFSIEDNPEYEKFPGTFFVFNGEKSVHKKVEQGTVSFTSDSEASEVVQGSFDITFTDYDSGIVPPPQYHLAGMFSFKIGSYGPATTVSVTAAP